MLNALFFCILGPIIACPQPSAQYVAGKGETLAYAPIYQARDAFAYGIYAVPLQQQQPVVIVRNR